jgi:hypothetical protein
MELTKQDLIDALQTANGGRGNSGGGGASGAGGTGAGLGDIIKSSVGVVSAFTSITNNGNNAATSLQRMASVIPGIGGAAGKAIGELDGLRTGTLINAQQGVSMSFLDMQDKATKAGLSQAQYLQAVNNSGIALDAVSGNATGSAEKLLKLGNSLQEGDLGKNLKEKTNMAAAELGNLAIVSQYGAKANLDNPKAMERASQFAGELATNLHRTSQVTGQTHQALTAALEERLKEPGTVMMMRRMTEQQREAYVTTQVSLLGMGKSVGDLSDTIAKGGRYTKDNVTALMAMGPAAGEFQRATYALTHAKTKEQKEAAEQALEKAKSHVNEFQSSQRFQNMVNRSTPEMGAAMSKIAEENRTAGRQIGAKAETGMVGTKADQANRDKVDLQGQGLVKGADGKVTQDPRRGVDQALSRAEVAAQRASGAGTGALADTSAKIGGDAASIKKFDDAMKTVFGGGGTTEAAAAKLKADFKLLGDVTGIGKPGAASAAPTAAGASAVGNREIGKPKPGRAGGSKEATGNWFENFGAETAVNLHGDEAVVPKAQVKTFMQDMQERAAKQMPKPAADTGKNMLTDMLPKGGVKVPEVKPPELPKLSEEQLKTLAEGPGQRNQGKGSPFYQEALKLQEDIKARASAAKTEAPKAELPKLDIPKVELPKAGSTKEDVMAQLKQQVADATPKVQPPKTDIKVEPPKVEAPKVEPPKVESKPEETKVEPPKVESKPEETKVEPPKAEPPKLDIPKVEPPKAEPPKLDIPKVELPKAETPKVEPPKLDIPKIVPKVEAPKLDIPKVEAPKVDIPKLDIPKVEAPKAEPSIFDRIKTQITSMLPKTSAITAPAMPKLDNINTDIAKPVTAPPVAKPVPKIEQVEKPVEQPKVSSVPAALPTATGSSAVSIKDLNDQLIMLNKQMGQMISHAATTSEASQKTAKSTSRPAGSRALA